MLSRSFVPAALLLVSLRCGTPSTAPGADGGSPAADAGWPEADGGAPAADGGPATPVDAGTAAACSGKSTGAGDYVWSVSSGGRARTFRVHVPASYSATAATPVVLNFHGFGSDAAQQEALSRMVAVSNEGGFIAVAPQGVNAQDLGQPSLVQQRSWNAGSCCGVAVDAQVDDVAFVRALLGELETKLCVDGARVYATGLSNGGFFSYRLACELADRIAAVAPVAGGNVTASCAPSRPVPLMHFHGTADGLVPYNGGGSSNFPNVPATVKAWAEKNACATSATAKTYEKGDSTCVTYEGCVPSLATATLCTVTNGGHTWRGGVPIPVLGATTTDLDASREMWKFFRARAK